MIGVAQTRAYAQVDFSEPNTLFVESFKTRFPGYQPETMLDLGCGPGEIPIRFAVVFAEARIVAVDGSQAMLAHARSALMETDFVDRITLMPCRITDIPAATYKAVISNSLLHHLSDATDLWQTIKRHGAPGAAVLVMDLARPATVEAAQAMVKTYAGDAPHILREDFFNSLCAAYTLDEVQGQLNACGLHDLQASMVSDRHLQVHGWLPE